MRSSDILFAHCTHEDGGSDLFKRMKEKNPEFWKRGDDLEHDDNNVFTPDWCPIEKLSNQQKQPNL
ncbi:hypothetical protein GO755_30550 [Spirosoma sp. HMF4905]|uniref:Uncharacterized protein n=2 Tax=Spirosoma arboris TaxID=2682092 RepID=A0A7K1SKR9_9BACT|nr:hypothetical protein [Spirosoma arboris]